MIYFTYGIPYCEGEFFEIVEWITLLVYRGHCSVTLLSEVETVSSYTSREDAFFYALVFDPTQKTLLADRGSIRCALCFSEFFYFCGF
jgi:hypothetical protein